MGSNDRSNSQRKGWGASAQPPPSSTTSTNLNISVIPTSTVPSMTPAEPVAAVPTDAALIAAWRGGDEPAAAELVRRHARALARFLAGAGALEADVDDLVQETFIRAFRALGRFRGQCQFRTWLMTIGGNVLKDAHRRSRRARVVPLGDDLRATDGDPHERAVAGEAGQRLRKSTRLNSSHLVISYAVFCLKKKKKAKSAMGLGRNTSLCVRSSCVTV